MGLILFREAFNLGRILNDARLNLVELRAGKGGDGAAFGRFFRLWAFLRGAVEMDGREGERAGERLKRGKDGARREKKRGKSGRREDKSGLLGLFWVPVGALAGCSCMMLRTGRLKGA